MLKSSSNFGENFAIFLLILIILLSLNYYFLLQKVSNQTKKVAEKIDSALSQNFEQVENILIAIGKKISNQSPNLDLKSIHQILIQNLEVKNCYILSWSLVDWVNIDGYQMINAVIGIRENPPQVGLKRSYIHKSNKLWEIIFSEAAFGIPSGSYIIPVGVQIDDKNNSRIGAVSAGIDIKKIRIILKTLLPEGYSFMLIDEKTRKFVFGSEDSKKYLQRVFNSTPVSIDSESYIFKKEMEQKFPYEVWIGYNTKAFWLEFAKFSLLIFLTLVGLVFLRFRKFPR
jgi:hypothetical protein